MTFVNAYDTTTGQKLPYLVPEHHIDHPILGRNLSRFPSQQKQARKKAAPSRAARPSSTTPSPVDNPQEAPAVGDNTEGVTPDAEADL